MSALMLGLAGTPHCLAMCGPACAAVGRGGNRATAAFHLGRLASYAAGGAVAATGVAWIGAAGQAAAWLRPLWTLVHAAALGLGLYLLWRGRQPGFLERLGRAPEASGGWQVMRGPIRSGALGLGWVAWPCGLLQSALMVAALANGPWGGALVMSAFATTSAAGLAAGPTLWWRLMGRAPSPAMAAWAVRAAGAMLAGAASWSLGHGLWAQFWAWCVS